MNQRKLIKLGNSSYAIALPKDWVDKAGLGKGDNVYIMPNSNGELIIQPSFKNTNGEKKVDIKTDDKDPITLRREITSHYINGYNLINLKGKRNRETSDAIKKTLKDLVGMEIIKEEAEEVIVKDLFNIEEMNLNNFLRRIDNNLREMFGILLSVFSKKKVSQSSILDLNEADDDINKFHILISRILSIGVDNPSILTRVNVSSLWLMNNWWISFNLEHIGDQIKSISKILTSEKLNNEEYDKIGKLLISLKELYASSMDAFYSEISDKEEVLKLTNQGKKLWVEFDKLSLSKKSTVAKVSIKLKEVETFIYQNLKVVLNNKP